MTGQPRPRDLTNPVRRTVSIRNGMTLEREVHVLAHELAHVRNLWKWDCLRGDDGADREAVRIITGYLEGATT